MTDSLEIVRTQLAEWLREAQELREVEYPSAHASPQEFYETLVSVRSRLDRVESLLSQAAGLRGSTSRRLAELHDEAEDAWDRTAQTARRSPVTREFEGARERYVDWNLAVLPQRQQERQMKRLADLVKETEERIRLVYNGLSSVRQDCHKALGYLQWESSIER